MLKNKPDILIVKSYEFNMQLAKKMNIGFISIIDIRDCAVLAHKSKPKKYKHNLGILIDHMIKNIKYVQDWKPYINYEFIYEKYKKDQINITKDIVRVLDITLTHDQIDNAINNLYNSISKKDNTLNKQIYEYRTFFTNGQLASCEKNNTIYRFLKNI